MTSICLVIRFHNLMKLLKRWFAYMVTFLTRLPLHKTKAGSFAASPHIVKKHSYSALELTLSSVTFSSATPAFISFTFTSSTLDTR